MLDGPIWEYFPPFSVPETLHLTFSIPESSHLTPFSLRHSSRESSGLADGQTGRDTDQGPEEATPDGNTRYQHEAQQAAAGGVRHATRCPTAWAIL